MSDSPLVGKVRPRTEAARPNFYSRVGGRRSIPPAVEPSQRFDVRLIYFDQSCSSELIDNMESTSAGRTLLNDLDGNQRSKLVQLIRNIIDFKGAGPVDLGLLTEGGHQRSWTQLHPDQVIAIKGMVVSAKDVQPSSLRLDAGPMSVRVFVERTHFLHLNQSYLSGLPISVIGTVRSVPRTEMSAAAIGTWRVLTEIR